MALTMLISGLWHGAHWKFVAWGGVHAIGRVCTRRLEQSAFYRRRVPRCIKRAWVFAFVCFCWIFFRADSFGDALTIIKRIFTADWTNPQCPPLMIALILAVWAYQYLYESRARRLLELAWFKVPLAAAMLLYLAFFATASDQPFIYFQF